MELLAARNIPGCLHFFLWKRSIYLKTFSLPEDSELYAYDQSWWPCMKHHSSMTQMTNPKPWQEKKEKYSQGYNSAIAYTIYLTVAKKHFKRET